ncbi:MAG: hypothetical protein IPJ65_19480 [Archangiaceae bacterium]|nr:hypothetical protein [Archangiaceae bacterium]
MTLALLGLLLAVTDAPGTPAAPEVQSVEPLEPEPPPPVWEIYVGMLGGMRVDERGGGGGVMVGVNRKFLGFLRPELMIASSLESQPFDYLILIRVGAWFELPLQSRWKPYLWAAFAHNHESGVEDVKRDPLGHLLGLSATGVHHRSGGELGLGLAYEVPRLTPWKIASRLGARLTFTQFMSDPYPPRYLDLTFTAGLCF